MKDQFRSGAGPRLSSVEGLKAAGVLAAFHFDFATGLCGVTYTSQWLGILRSGDLLFADPFYVAALQLDDPVAMRMWVERISPVVPEEGGPEEGGPEDQASRKPRRDRKASR